MRTQPSQYKPKTPEDFIGPARAVAGVLCRKADAARQDGCPMKVLLHGDPGTGKTAVANVVATRLAFHSTAVETVNGKAVDVDLVRKWHSAFPYRHLGDGFRVIVINEVDTITRAAQDLLLSVLDELPAWWTVIGTMNKACADVTARFQTRFQQFTVGAPSVADIAALLETFGLNGQAKPIAQGCGGNVRAALLDAQSVLDCKLAS